MSDRASGIGAVYLLRPPAVASRPIRFSAKPRPIGGVGQVQREHDSRKVIRTGQRPARALPAGH
jgi:hypothetical protein